MAGGGHIWFGHFKKCTGLVLDHLRDFLSLGAPWLKSSENISKLQNVNGTFRQVLDHKISVDYNMADMLLPVWV